MGKLSKGKSSKKSPKSVQKNTEDNVTHNESENHGSALKQSLSVKRSNKRPLNHPDNEQTLNAKSRKLGNVSPKSPNRMITRNQKGNQGQINNNATIAKEINSGDMGRCDTVVGSAKSLINSIKNRRKMNKIDEKSSDSEVMPGTSDQNEQEQGDGVSVDYNSSEDDYRDEVANPENSGDEESSSPEATDSENESETNSESETGQSEVDSGSDNGKASYSETPDSSEDERELMNDPRVQRLLKKLSKSDRKAKDRGRYKYHHGKNSSSKRSHKTGHHNERRYRSRSRSRSRSKQRGGAEAKRRNAEGRGNGNRYKLNPLAKSPSDTTLYTPALRRAPIYGSNEQPLNNVHRVRDLSNSPSVKDKRTTSSITGSHDTMSQIDRISNFVDMMRGESARRSSDKERDDAPTRVDERKVSSKNSQNQAKELADKMIQNAEQFKATVAAPQGTNK